MRMDQWGAVLDSEELSNDKEDEGAISDDDEQFLDTLLKTSSSWCNGTTLWFPTSKSNISDDNNEDDDDDDDDETFLDYYSRSSESESAWPGAAVDQECSPQACDLHCVCVDCVKCPHHCACNYTRHDYECRDVRSTMRKNSNTKQRRDETRVGPYGVARY